VTTTDHPRPIELRSDNCAGAAPELLAALAEANTGSALAYGGDEWSARLQARVDEVFEHPDATVFPVLTGTAANSLALSALCPPWGAVLCHETAHIIRNECATTNWGDPHHSQPSALSLTNPTDFGTVYSVDRVRELAATARSRGLRVHMDGARIANAIAALGCTPAELTWRAGADVISLGATKNGAVTTDAIVCFDPSLAEQLTYRVKRAGQVASKMRFQSAQLEAYLTDGLWLRLASTANAAMARLAAGLEQLGIGFVARPEANIAFVQVDDALADRLEAAGLLFYRTESGVIRFVTSFQTTPDDVDDALGRIAEAQR
jgi:threonine aldolase